MNGDNYEYLQASDADRQPLAENRLHHVLSSEHFTGHLRGDLEAISYVHVGTGELLRPAELTPRPTNDHLYPLAAPFFRQTHGSGAVVRVIPGSSFRGVIRSLVEAMTYSGFGASRGKVPGQLRESTYSAQEQSVASPPLLDPASQMFGGQGYASHVHVRDLYTEDTNPWELIRVGNRWLPKVRYPGDRKVYLHKKDYTEGEEILEACPPGVIWNFEIQIRNLPLEHVGVLLTALGQHRTYPLFPKMGGGKGQGMGSVKIHSVQIFAANIDQMYLTYEPEYEPLTESDMERCFSMADSTIINQDALKRLHQLIGELPK